ncbi:thiaminase II [Ureibacillus sp. FSL K6-8385]|uniref:Aminopyrimidine aminohydrolase n=1 Tax=Ureibacillus terrenus TaxID=118246 RepID=A0A540V581_9BACL|nr:thiaminase II [Ureibacillus terrenus]MED3661103.1 thiaminase II [Ureibacillus terrenus]MED3764419.1 thiaminase II [Ureibacillus terrenus]TQE91915.1 thiaminase II [Ureibacillus terrenus]
MKFTDRIFEKYQSVWRKNHEHPFVKELGAGTLDPGKFRFYMIQDYLYLIEYSKLFALGAVKATNLEVMTIFANLLYYTMNGEMELHRNYASRFGITERELEEAEPSPVTLAYTHYMLAVAQNGSLAELVAAHFACAWSYWEIGCELAKIEGAKEHELYGDWIKTYSSEEFGQSAQWNFDLLNELAEGKPESELLRLEDIFLNTTRFEYMFWDMAYRKQMWPMDEQVSV